MTLQMTLKRLRSGKFTQCQLAILSGVSRQTIAMIENGKREEIGSDTAKSLAIALGTTVDELLEQPKPKQRKP